MLIAEVVAATAAEVGVGISMFAEERVQISTLPALLLKKMADRRNCGYQKERNKKVGGGSEERWRALQE
jgi:hypothetical protein